MSKEFPENWIVAGVLELRINRVSKEIEKCWKKGVSESFGWLFGPFSDFIKKGQNFACGYGNYLYITDIDNKIIQQAFIVPQSVLTINSRLVVKKKAMASDNFMTYLPALVVLGLPRPRLFDKVMYALSNMQ